MIIASSAALVVGTFLLLILSNHTGFFYKQSSVVNEGLNLNDALQEISNYIRQASYISTGYPEVNPTYTTSSDTLVLKLLSVDLANQLLQTYDYVVISKDPSLGKILMVQVFPHEESSRPAANKVLTNILKSISFTFLDKANNPVTPSSAWQIGATLEVESKTGSVGSQRSSSILTTLRNN